MVPTLSSSSYSWVRVTVHQLLVTELLRVVVLFRSDPCQNLVIVKVLVVSNKWIFLINPIIVVTLEPVPVLAVRTFNHAHGVLVSRPCIHKLLLLILISHQKHLWGTLSVPRIVGDHHHSVGDGLGCHISWANSFLLICIVVIGCYNQSVLNCELVNTLLVMVPSTTLLSLKEGRLNVAVLLSLHNKVLLLLLLLDLN